MNHLAEHINHLFEKWTFGVQKWIIWLKTINPLADKYLGFADRLARAYQDSVMSCWRFLRFFKIRFVTLKLCSALFGNRKAELEEWAEQAGDNVKGFGDSFVTFRNSGKNIGIEGFAMLAEVKRGRAIAKPLRNIIPLLGGANTFYILQKRSPQPLS